MGCCISKKEAPQPAVPPAVLSEPPYRSTRPPSRQNHPSRPPSRQNHPSRPPSRQKPSSRPHSRSGSSSGPRKHTHNRRSIIAETIVEDQPAEDRAIVGEVSQLSMLIEQHVRNFYHHSGGEDPRARRATLRQQITQKIVDVIAGREGDSPASNSLSARLRPFASDAQNEKRNQHMDELCKLGASIGRQMRAHPAAWDFGDWHGEGGATVVFPSLLKDLLEVRRREIVKV